VLRSCRQAEAGSLSADALVGLATPVDRGLRVLGGLPVVDRWPELRGSALDRLWEACRRAFDVTVVDVGFCLERDEGAGPFSTVRNAAALSVLGQAESVVAVADGSALGAARLVGAWPALERAAAGAVTVVGNRRSSRDWDAAVRALGVAAPVHRVPEDARALAACWARGRTLRQGARRSGLRRSLAGLADAVVRR
jgi:Flp pilus assembly CpaE family ATPase